MHLDESRHRQSRTSLVAARLLGAGLIVSWVKLLKYARAFPTFGPFAVMLGNMIGDIIKFTFLYVGALARACEERRWRLPNKAVL